jgi:hypothetical protein
MWAGVRVADVPATLTRSPPIDVVEAWMWAEETVWPQVRRWVRQLPERVWPTLAETRFSLAAGRVLTTKRSLKMRRMIKARRMSLRLQV